MDPLSLVTWQTWIHISLGIAVAWIGMPFGVGLGRIGSDWHKSVQIANCLVLVCSVSFAFWGNWHSISSSGHAMFGILLLVFTFSQAAVGYSMTIGHRNDAGLLQISALHKTGGTLTAVAMALIQAPLGFVALFGICTEAPPCLGHFIVALGLVAAAIAYYSISLIQQQHVVDVRYDLYAAENGAISAAGMAVMLFAYYSGDIWSESLGAIVACVATGTLYHLRQLHRKTLPIALYMQRGVPTAASFVGAATVFALKPQIDGYGRAMHMFFAGQIATAALLRLFVRWQAISMVLTSSAVVFVGAQRDFQLLYPAFYAKKTPLATVIFTAALVGVVFFLLGHLWWKNFGKKPTLSYRIEELVNE